MKKILFSIILFSLVTFSSFASASLKLVLDVKDVLDLAIYSKVIDKELLLEKDRESFKFSLPASELSNGFSEAFLILDIQKFDENLYSVRFIKKIRLENGKLITVSDKFISLDKTSGFEFSDFYRNDTAFLRQINNLKLVE